MLILLDNARNVDQVRLLLPGAAACAVVVVTSRDSLAGLVARHGARCLDLDLLPPGNAVALLRTLIGGRVDADPGAAAALAAQCARLPLALRVAAELAAARPAAPLAELVAELADQQRRLDLLDAGGDPRTAVRAVFSWSYHHLGADAARTFRLLGLHPGPDYDRYAAAALTSTPLEQAGRLLDQLARAHLIHPTRTGRHAMHDLLGGYAAGQAHADEAEDAQREALTGLFDHYLTTAAAAMDVLVPGAESAMDVLGLAEARRRPQADRASHVPPLRTAAQARGWLEAERETLVALTAYAAAHGWHRHASCLAAILVRFFAIFAHRLDPAPPAMLAPGVHAAGQADARAARATALRSLGAVEWWPGRDQEATGHYLRALTISRELGDRGGEADTLRAIGFTLWLRGRYREAASRHRRALAIFRELGDREGEARTLFSLGFVTWEEGRHEDAADHSRQALAIARELGDRGGEACVLDNLGVALWREGRYADAARYHREALAIFGELGDKRARARALTGLGRALSRQGFYPEAGSCHRRALATFRELGSRGGVAVSFGNLGGVLLRQGRYQESASCYRQALAICRELGDQLGEAFQLTGLGSVLSRQGHHQQASDHQQQAAARFRDLGNQHGEACAVDSLGIVLSRQCRYQEAVGHHRQALALHRALGNRSGEAEALNGIGENMCAAGQPDQGRARHGDALILVLRTGDRYEQARGHQGLARACQATGDLGQARCNWQRALALYTGIGVPEADQVRAALDSLPNRILPL